MTALTHPCVRGTYASMHIGKRYRATLIDTERYLLTCMRYIERNPVRARMVRHPRDYPWSSYGAHAHGKTDVLLRHHALYQRLGRGATVRQAAYRALFKTPIEKNELETIRAATNKAWVLGDDRFKGKVERLAGRRAAPLARGRPRTA
jgi:putative transposase